MPAMLFDHGRESIAPWGAPPDAPMGEASAHVPGGIGGVLLTRPCYGIARPGSPYHRNPAPVTGRTLTLGRLPATMRH